MAVAHDRQKHRAQLRMAYAREVQLHGPRSRQAVLAHADYVVERVRLEVCPDMIGWAEPLDAAHRAAVADLLRTIADRIDRTDQGLQRTWRHVWPARVGGAHPSHAELTRGSPVGQPFARVRSSGSTSDQRNRR